MKDFARVTKLTNIRGRADYISNPDRQEEIVARSALVDWEPYSRFEQSNQRTASRNNEGREIVIALPNEWSMLHPAEIALRVEEIVEVALGKTTDYQWAVHWNKALTNLHLHVVFSERQREAVGRWDRDVYLTADGKVARTKSERARLPDGSIAPPIHRKGDEKGGFTAKDTKYKTRQWVCDMKQSVRDLMRTEWHVQIDNPNPLHEYHEGKGKDAPLIKEKNRAVRLNNQNYPVWRKAFPQIREAGLKQLCAQASKAGKVLCIAKNPDGQLMSSMVTVDKWFEIDRQMRELARKRDEDRKKEQARPVMAEPPKTAQKPPEERREDIPRPTIKEPPKTAQKPPEEQPDRTPMSMFDWKVKIAQRRAAESAEKKRRQPPIRRKDRGGYGD